MKYNILYFHFSSWKAPISFALYAPGNDFYATMESIVYVRNCLPESELIRDYVTFHIYIQRRHLPSFLANTEQEILQWPFNCNITPPYTNVNLTEMYRNVHNLTYPINIGRNIARKSANTHFIFACDIEFYPNYGLVKNFLNMIEKNPKIVLNSVKPKVFVIPVYELATNSSIPNTKSDLTKMFQNNTATIFHNRFCPFCYRIPQQEEWLKSKDSNTLKIFTTIKRHGNYSRWETFYISDNTEPIFDERVDWKGELHKRIQHYAMCLQDYDYNILHPAFLVYVPGIKSFDMATENFNIRFKYWNYMRTILSGLVMRGYQILYGHNEKCEV